jgi:threonine dehydrogenase-like Zn-dependent dehydrogenase
MITFEPIIAINKELNLQFVICYTAEEYTSTLRNIADGKIAVDPLITGRIPLMLSPKHSVHWRLPRCTLEFGP